MESKNYHDSASDILLVDSSISVKEFVHLKQNFKKIITLDIISNRMLEEKEIPHMVSDDLLDEFELQLIDSSCVNFCQWYNQNNGDELLSYENVNLGSLFRVEFYNFLIPIVKNLLILNKLKNLHPDSLFFCSSNLSQIANNLGINLSIIHDKLPNIDLTWDKIEYNITSSLSLKLSKHNYDKLKNLSNLVNNLLIKKKTKNENNTFALIEFDPIKYQNIFNESNNRNSTTYLYNRHRPISYNVESLKIIKNSKIFPYVPSKNSIKVDKKEINSKHKKLLDNFYQFIENSEFFNSFFTFQNIKFWKYIKPLLIKIFEKKISDSIYEIEYAKFFLLNHNIKSVVIQSESGFTEQIILNLAKKLSINIILLQHGVIVDTPPAFDHNKTVYGILPIYSDHFFSWGRISSEYIHSLDNTSSKIHLIGNANLDRIGLKKKHNRKNSDNVLLLATGPRNHQSIGHDVNAWKVYESTIKSIYDIVSKQNLNLIIKRHPDIAENDFSESLYSSLSNVKIQKSGDLSNLLLNSKIVLSLGISSGILEAQILEKPVISISSKYDVFGTGKYVPNSCLEIKIEEFDKIFTKIITNPNEFNLLIQKGSHYLFQNTSNIGTVSSTFFDTLEKL